MLKTAGKVISYLEDSHIPFSYFCVTFIAILILRCSLDVFFPISVSYFNVDSIKFIAFMCQYGFAYISSLLTVTLFIHLTMRISLISLLRVVMTGYSLLITGSVINLIASRSDPLSLGFKVNMLLVLAATYTYFRMKGKNIIFSLLNALSIGVFILFYFATPLIVQFIVGKSYFYDNPIASITQYYAILISLVGCIILYRIDKKIFLTIVKDLRWLRLAHYALMVILGATFAMNDYSTFFHQPYLLTAHPGVLNHLLLIMICILCAGLFSIVTNNITDLAIDRISNQSRPLVTDTISLLLYQRIGWIALCVAFIYALLVDYKAFFIIAFITANYYLYSMPPLRFKRVPLFSKLVISINSLALIVLGFLLVKTTLNDFPSILFPIYLAGFTLAINFIDIKDDIGDKQNGIRTLPGLIGLKNAKCLISLAFLLTYCSFSLLLPHKLYFWLLFAGGLIQVYLINKKNYQEKSVFIFYLLSMLILIVLLFRKM